DGAIAREAREGLVAGEVADGGRVEPVERDPKGLGGEAPPTARGAGEAPVGEEQHLDRLVALALADLAAAAFDVEREIARAELALLGLGRLGEAFAEDVPDLEVGRRVAAGGAPERRLIDGLDVTDPLDALERIEGQRRIGERDVERARDGGVERLQHERALSAP